MAAEYLSVVNLNDPFIGTPFDDRLQVEFDANAPINTLGGNDVVRIGSNANQPIELGGGMDRLVIHGDANGTIDAGNQNDIVRIGGNANQLVDLGRGADYLHIAGTANGPVDGGRGDDIIKIFGGANQLVDGGRGADRIHVEGVVNAAVEGGNGNDRISLASGGTAFGEKGDDTFVFDYSDTNKNALTNYDGGDGFDRLVLVFDTPAELAEFIEKIDNGQTILQTESIERVLVRLDDVNMHLDLGIA